MGEIMIPAMIWDLQERVRTQVPPKEEHPTGGSTSVSPHIDFDHYRQGNTSPVRPAVLN